MVHPMGDPTSRWGVWAGNAGIGVLALGLLVTVSTAATISAYGGASAALPGTALVAAPKCPPWQAQTTVPPGITLTPRVSLHVRRRWVEADDDRDDFDETS